MDEGRNLALLLLGKFLSEDFENPEQIFGFLKLHGFVTNVVECESLCRDVGIALRVFAALPEVIRKDCLKKMKDEL